VTLNSAARFPDVYRSLCERMEAVDFSGADPFDALNSAIFAKLPVAKMKLARLAWLQLFKRSPIDLRRVTMVRPTANAVTLALAARTYACAHDHAQAQRMIERLLDARCDSTWWRSGAWGYPFPWQARAFYVPAGVPNVIATAYAVRAIDDCRPADGVTDRIVFDAAQFVTERLVRRTPRGTYIGYVPGSAAMVHNANLWGAYILALAASRGKTSYTEMANAAVDYTLRAQRPDGSWIYGEAHHHGWTDGFHSGYVLEALDLCRVLLGREDLLLPIRRGAKYYLSHFLTESGTVPYYANGTGALDVNNFAQMVITLERVRPRPDWPLLADRVLTGAIRDLWRPELKAFAYQRLGSRVNKIFYPRWTQIWMMHALALRIYNESRSVVSPTLAAL
jgi:hypothetical protein